VIETPYPRIVSLLPAATEIVAALGFQDHLVGRSHECDYPPGVDALPICTKALIEPKGTSVEIDAEVKNALKHALSIYDVLTDVLATTKPDIIVTQDQCDVCAVALKDVEAAVCDVLNSDAQIVSLDPQGLAKVWDDIRAVAHALDADAAGADLIARLQTRLDAVKTRSAGSSTPRPRVVCIEWADPLMAAGNWVPELVEIAGGIDPFGQAGTHAPWLETQQLIDEDPDVIIFMPCGFDLARSETEASALLSTPAWQRLSAVQSGRVFATDANSYFNRPGPRLVDSTEMLADMLAPDAPDSGIGWRRVIKT
jgi:iron complex transport system substrate-binding protein